MNTIQVQMKENTYQVLLDTLSRKKVDPRLAHEAELELLGGKTYLWTDSYGFIDLEISADHVEAICHSGDNESACRAAIEEDGYLRSQLNAMDLDKARECLKDAGIEDVDSKDEDLVRVYILWMACWDIHEERNMED